MRVYKATDADMSCHMGRGVFPYRLGVPAEADASRCGGTGLHACEYVLDCTGYYSLRGGHRFFEAEAEGDIAEDGVNTRIACTRLTLLKELDNRQIARAAMQYMIRHPRREGWEKSGLMVMAAADEAWADAADGIAIARGPEPKVRGAAGAHLGWIREQDGMITEAYLLTVQGCIQPGVWYTIEDAKRAIEEGGSR